MRKWSEEDKEMVKFYLDFTDYKLGCWPNTKVIEMRKKFRNWLKSLPERLQLKPSWKPSEDEERLINTSISFLKDFADKGYENAVECIDWLKSKLNGNSGK